jgi:hypothetical protein
VTAAPIYQWPESAKFGRVIPKSKFYERANVSASLRDRFVADVQRIRWAYKLAESTIHLSGDARVPEIQVFVIDAKARDVADEVLSAIDDSVKFPIIFEVRRSDGPTAETRTVAAYKRLGGVRPKLSQYFSSEWMSGDSRRSPMPSAVNLGGLYAGLIKPLIPIATRPGETVSEVTARIENARKLDREIAKLEKQLRNEPQFNRRVELRRQLTDRISAHNALLGPQGTTIATPNSEDHSWNT